MTLRTAIFVNALPRLSMQQHEGMIVVRSETLNASVNAVASDVVRHAFNQKLCPANDIINYIQ